MPVWMEPYRELIGNTGGNSIEEMMVDDSDPRINLPRCVLAVAVKSQVGLLMTLRERAMLAEIIKPAPMVRRTHSADPSQRGTAQRI